MEKMRRKLSTILLLSVVLLSLLLSGHVVCALEAKWTPADEENGPLPLSSNQRAQLTKLYETIANSPDPQGTLVQVAKANSMEPQELADILNNHMKSMGGMAGGGVRDSKLKKLVSLTVASFTFVIQNAMRNPKQFSIIFTTIFFLLYIMYTAPRTGIVMSRSPGLISRGHTTFFAPPKQYITNYISGTVFKDSKNQGRAGLSRRISDVIEDFAISETTFDKVGRGSESNKDLSLSVTARKEVPLDILVDHEDLEHLDDDDVYELMQETADTAYDAAKHILSSRRFTEYSPGDNLKFYSSPPSSKSTSKRRSSTTEKETAALVFKALGDFRRYGVQPLRLAYEESIGSSSNAVAFQTTKGGHFDGELRFSVECLESSFSKDDDDEFDKKIIMSVSLVIPKKGRKLSKKRAEKLARMFVDSITTSSTSEAKRMLVRLKQTSAYRNKAKARATEKRSSRHEEEKKIEEMAKDRRKRWRRAGGAGERYRPSGISSPSGGPRFG